MHLSHRTITHRIIEISRKELNEKGFDKIWDEIRVVYSIDEYEIESIIENVDSKLIIVSLRLNKYKFLAEQD